MFAYRIFVSLATLPKRMLILGGGIIIIGLEMGTVYSSLGARLDCGPCAATAHPPASLFWCAGTELAIQGRGGGHGCGSAGPSAHPRITCGQFCSPVSTKCYRCCARCAVAKCG